jgi:microcystin-dependent protein
MAGTIGNASSTVNGITKLSIDPVSPTLPIAVGDNDTRIPTTAQTTFLGTLTTGLVGELKPYAGRTAPTGWLNADGSTKVKATYPNLFAALYPSLTCTRTIASPGVITTTAHGFATAHGFVVGDSISFSTTGGLPSGLTAGVRYYVISAGLTTNAFEVALSPSGTAVVTSGSQSGAHTVYWSNYGPYDGTNFYLPDTRGVTIMGAGSTASTFSLSFEAGAVGTNTINVPDGDYPSQGQAVTLTGTLPTGLATSTTYYVQRVSSTQIKLATTQALANSAAADKTFTSSGMSGVCTIVYTLTARTSIGKRFGEEMHGVSVAELAGHTHTYGIQILPSANGNNSNSFGQSGTSTTNSTGGDTQHNNIQPTMTCLYIIKY